MRVKKVYDCFPFFNELDLLEIRLNELYDVVDYFVIVEGEKTHQNNPKPLFYLENKERYSKFQDKIVHVILDESSFNESPAHNEDISYNAIMYGLQQTNASDDDIVIINCADEILKPEVIKDLVSSYVKPVCIEVHNFCYYLNTQFAEGSLCWWGGPIISVRHLNEFNGQVKRCLEWGRRHETLQSSTATDIPLPHGWHFTFMGNAKEVRAKVTSYIHKEWSHLTEEDYQSSIENMVDPFKRGGPNSHKFVGMYPIEELPTYVQKNLDKFSHLIKK